MLFFPASLLRGGSRCISLFVMSGALSGCAYVSQQAHLAPHPTVSPGDIGRGAPVVVRVVDARPTRRIGYRGMDSKLGEITTEQDVAALVRQKIVEGLKVKGFNSVA